MRLQAELAQLLGAMDVLLAGVSAGAGTREPPRKVARQGELEVVVPDLAPIVRVGGLGGSPGILVAGSGAWSRHGAGCSFRCS